VPKVVVTGVLLLAAFALAGCGGGGRKNHDPANAILKSLGLEECSSRQVPSSVIVGNSTVSGVGSFAGARIFETAADCSKKGPRTTIYAATFSTHEGVAAGAAGIKKLHPKAGVATFRTVVVGVVGPNAQQTADKIVTHLSAGVINA